MEENKNELIGGEENNTETVAQTDLESLSFALNETKEEKPADSVDGEYNGVGNVEIDPSFFKDLPPYDNYKSCDDQISVVVEESFAKIKKFSLFSTIGSIVMIACFIAVLVTIYLTGGKADLAWVQWTVLGLAVATVIGMGVMNHFMNKKRTAVYKEYFAKYENTLNGYIVAGLKVNNPQIALDAKIADSDIIQAHYFKMINSIDSRAVVDGTRNGYAFRMGEVAVVIPAVDIEEANKSPEDFVNFDGLPHILTPVEINTTSTQEISGLDMTKIDQELVNEVQQKMDGDKKANVIPARGRQSSTINNGIFGRLHAYDMKVKSDESFIIAFKGDKRFTCLPDFLTGYTPIYVPNLRNTIIVYAVNSHKIAPFFDEEAVKILNEMRTGLIVQSAFISVNSYGTKVACNLSDDIMRLPQKKLNSVGSYDAYYDFVTAAFNFIDTVDQKREK